MKRIHNISDPCSFLYTWRVVRLVCLPINVFELQDRSMDEGVVHAAVTK
jgi:hypothetical protein